MTDLTTRLAQADKPTRELLEDVWEAINGDRKFALGLEPDPFAEWIGARQQFRRMLDAEAWTSAVEMLKPEGWWVQHLGECIGGWRCRIETNGPPSQSLTAGFSPHEPLPCAALALAIACLKARGL